MIILSEHIQRIFIKYMDGFEGTRLKPKAHFVMHYPKMIERFCTLVKALRFESVDWYFKDLYSNNKNRKNVCQYLTKCHQFMIYLHHNNENIPPHNDAIGTQMSETPVKLLDFKHKNTVLEYFNLKDTELLCKLPSLVFDRQLFPIGDIIVVTFANDKYIFGVIEFVFFFRRRYLFFV